MITLRITFKFRKDVWEENIFLTLLCFLNDIQIISLRLFHLSESDHQSETTMMTHQSQTTMMTHQSETTMTTYQMGLMHHGKRTGMGFCGLQSKLFKDEVRMTAVV